MKRIGLIAKRVTLLIGVAVLGFVVGVSTLYVYRLRGGPPLQVWHTELLTEFTAEQAEAFRTFEAYVDLEEQLAAQVDERIYAHTETGPDFVLARYSAGSAADPRGRRPDWNRSVELPTARPVGGVLLLHGMSDSPYSLRALGESLNQRGYQVLAIRLPGHGTVPSGLTTLLWEDMAAAVELAMKHLASRVGRRPIHIVGYSTGAPLAVHYALAALAGTTAPRPASLVLISPALGVTAAAPLAKWLGRLARVPGLEKLAWVSLDPEFDPYKYNSFAANAAYQVHRLIRSVVGAVEARAASGPIEDFPPTLIFLSTVDATVSAAAVIDHLLEHLAPDRHELVLFDINRNRLLTTLLVADPGPLTARLMGDATLPFHLTLVTNESSDSRAVVLRRKAPLSSDTSSEPLGLAWPVGTLSLSHVALPFPPDDPLYGRREFAGDEVLHLGQLAIQGERGLLKISSDWLLRLRHNPFYDFLESRALQWVDGAGNREGLEPAGSPDR